MHEFLVAARKSIEAAAQVLEANQAAYIRNYSTSGLSDYHKRRAEITEQWLKLAAIEAGLNPYQPASASTGHTGDSLDGRWSR